MGIFCLTPENLAAPWLAFEAGALFAKDRYRVATFLHRVDTSLLRPPLSLFQATKSGEKQDVLDLVKSINKRIAKPLEVGFLQRAFDSNWGEFEATLRAVPEPQDVAQIVAPDPSEILEEILNTVRRLEHENVSRRELSRKAILQNWIKDAPSSTSLSGVFDRNSKNSVQGEHASRETLNALFSKVDQWVDEVEGSKPPDLA